VEDQPASPSDPAEDLVREIWGDPDRAPDFIRDIALLLSDVPDDEVDKVNEMKLRFIREYAERAGLLDNPHPQRGSRSA
jgi:hypothetical protein